MAREGAQIPLVDDGGGGGLAVESATVEANVETAKQSPSKHQRLVSLDIVRGFTMALMIFVDEIGEAYPVLNHSPWNYITLADYVMPWFLFMVGTSLSFSLKSFKADINARKRGTRHVIIRALKLWLLGVVLQGGGLPDGYQYGYNLTTMRFCGILERIAFAFVIAGLMEIWLPELHLQGIRSPHLAIFTTHIWKWLIAFSFFAVYLALTFGTFVPTWTSRWGYNATLGNVVLLNEPFEIKCDVRGATATPECSALGFYDRMLFGQDRLGVWMSARLPECSSCSPGGPEYNCGTSPERMKEHPRWCFAHMYDPEGALATVPTVLSVWLGTHFGRAHGFEGIGRNGPSMALPAHWSIVAIVLLGIGLALHAGGLLMNKQLWSPSYLFFMAGTCGASLTVIWALVDSAPADKSRIRGARRLLAPLQYMGMNAILVFFWHGLAQSLLNCVYVAPPQIGGGFSDASKGAMFGKNGWFFQNALGFIDDTAIRQLIYVLLKICCFMIGTWLCFRNGYFWKI